MSSPKDSENLAGKQAGQMPHADARGECRGSPDAIPGREHEPAHPCHLFRSLAPGDLFRCSASSLASVVPPGSPRKPLCKQQSIVFHVSRSTPWTGPELLLGHLPVRSWCSWAHFRIWVTL